MISIIIVHYRNEKDLIECLSSLYQNTKENFEVIIVDNSENQKIKHRLSKFKNLEYISSKRNIGYGAGINLGVKHASGEYIFVLNPDTIFTEDILGRLAKKLNKEKQIGIIAPLLYTPSNKIMEQGARELTPLLAIFKFSFIDKLWNKNPISKNFWIKKWNNKPKQVDNIPGSAFLIKKNVFEKIGGFDENYFLYFEEFDLCKRVRGAGYKIFIDPSSKLIHKWGTTTKLLDNKDDIFKKSRFYYFRKHFGIIKALIIEIFLNINFNSLVLLSAIAVATTIRLYKIDEYIPYYGDIGWFYLSARDALLTGSLPLVGITSSHLWLHQGPIWTYLVAFVFYIYKFNPIAPYVFTAVFDIFTLILIYKLVKQFFTKEAALIASLIYVFSPAIILSARAAYHTSLIPFFVALFIYSLFRWVNNKKFYFPLIIFSLVMLYNFELQTIVLSVVFIGVFVYGFVKKKDWYSGLHNAKILLFSLIAFIIPMLPIIIYDFKNGFPQTIVFLGWILYKILKSASLSINMTNSFSQVFSFLNSSFQNIFFPHTNLIASVVVAISTLFLLLKTLKHKKLKKEFLLLLLIFIVLLGSIVLNKTSSNAYLMSLFVPVVIVVSIFISYLARNRYLFYLGVLILSIVGYLNITYLISNNYFIGFSRGYGPTFQDRLNVARYMVENSNGKTFTILGRGPGSEFENFTMNYQYLTWYLGKSSVTKNADLIYIITETPSEIKIVKHK
ncbi:MAG: hypothetical protein A3B38_01725 [Candidatus Levybacteria bacterium RIFCSPLOWO2_01_FULL_36_13]|nr:MAG: hypothetical protein A2684_02960 [Candidatus Levybacteria bacterium RIFCSPHIGHO2_01_FULL_36_15b]OGH35583.1 MAG: hypothetical protein A3B38_01725 [Candidatus Levybacteria bacterium RIFCSPLOWO2_01_FULL_36_13]